jgi:hypothetical protein
MLRKIGAASSYLIVDLLQVVVQIRLVGVLLAADAADHLHALSGETVERL